MPRRKVTHEGKDQSKGERGTVNHTPINTTARSRMGMSPVKGVGRIGGPADVAERLPEMDVHHCAPGGILRPTWGVAQVNAARICEPKQPDRKISVGPENSLLYQRISPGYIYQPVRILLT